MSVSKTVRECYEVRHNREWANITLRCWSRPVNAGTPHADIDHCGEITIQSSFGTWGNIWTACGCPFKVFLQRAEFDYVFTKFMGVHLERFDGDATFAQIQKDIVSQRKTSGLTKDEAREAWNLVLDERDRLSGAESDYGYAMLDIGRQLVPGHDMRDYFNDPAGWPRVTKPDLQATGFWRELWPSFIEKLREETTLEAEAA